MLDNRYIDERQYAPARRRCQWEFSRRRPSAPDSSAAAFTEVKLDPAYNAGQSHRGAFMRTPLIRVALLLLCLPFAAAQAPLTPQQALARVLQQTPAQEP